MGPAPPSASAVVHTIVTAAAGINHLQNQGFGPTPLVMTGGAAAGDFDNDGRVDVFVTRLDAPDILYRNKGDDTFEDVSTAADLTVSLQTNGPAWGDIDNDGNLGHSTRTVDMVLGNLPFLAFTLLLTYYLSQNPKNPSPSPSPADR